MKRIKIYIGILVLLLVVFFILESKKPKAIDWSPSFNKEHKRPWGTYILFQELNKLLPNATIESTEVTPYEQLISKNYYSNKSAYLFINNMLNIDKESLEELLFYVEEGNSVFMASQYFPERLMDTLNFTTDKTYNYYYYSKDSIKRSLSFVNKNLNNDDHEYNYNKGFENHYFNKLNKENTTVLGYSYVKDTEYINFVKIKFGSGNFYLNLQPYAFTNFNMLKDNHYEYIAKSFSYIKEDKVFWDNNNKSGITYINNKLRFILSKPALKWAWRIFWLSIIIFIIFKAKRKQRIVPIIEEEQNTSMAFAKTIGDLYYNEGNPKDIVNKKITFFLEYIRNTYLLDTQLLNDDFKKRLHLKTGVPKDEINRLINYISNLSNTSEIQENSLVTLNKLINKFYKKTKL